MEQIPTLPDAYFYYGLALSCVVSLILVLKWVGGRLVATLDKMGNDVSELKAGQQLHTQILKDQNQEIIEIKQKVFFSAYKEQTK